MGCGSSASVQGRVVELVDTRDLKSLGPKGPCRFESGRGYQPSQLVERSEISEKAATPKLHRCEGGRVAASARQANRVLGGMRTIIPFEGGRVEIRLHSGKRELPGSILYWLDVRRFGAIDETQSR